MLINDIRHQNQNGYTLHYKSHGTIKKQKIAISALINFAVDRNGDQCTTVRLRSLRIGNSLSGDMGLRSLFEKLLDMYANAFLTTNDRKIELEIEEILEEVRSDELSFGISGLEVAEEILQLLENQITAAA